MKKEFRRYLRKPVEVKFKADDGSGVGALYFDSGDLSIGGAFLKSDLLMEDGEELSLEFIVPGRGQVRTQARVEWTRRFPEEDAPAGMGVQFLDLDEESKEALAVFLQ